MIILHLSHNGMEISLSESEIMEVIINDTFQTIIRCLGGFSYTVRESKFVVDSIMRASGIGVSRFVQYNKKIEKEMIELPL